MSSKAAALRPPRFEGSIVLRDGRKLGFAEYGPSRGRPLVWFHGTPGARRQISPQARDAADEYGVRLVAVERPGIGASTPHVYRDIRGFAPDVEQLCDALEIGEFTVAGLSGGGPYALSCAHHMPDRVVAAALLGGVAPAVGPDAIEGGVSGFVRALSPILARTGGPLGASLRLFVRTVAPWRDEAVALFSRFMPPGDQRVFEDVMVREMFVDDILTGTELNMHALILDGIMFGRDWGFALEDVRVPVHMWYGDADNIVPLAHGQHVAARIPRSKLYVRKDEGHLGGLGASHEILQAMLEEWGKRASA